MSLTESTVPRQNPKSVWRKYLKGVVIEPGIALNETAAAIFMQIDGQKSVSEITKKISEEYDVDYPTCLKDTIAVLQDFVEQGFILVDARAQA